MKIIEKYFPALSEVQKSQFDALYALYAEWNAKINVVSRKDIENLYLHHVLHSLAIAEVIHFKPETRILDVGTGGGFPAIPLAIFFPEAHFTLIDSIGKKIRVATEVAAAVELKNVELKHLNAVEEKGKFDFVVSRAVMPLTDLVKLCRKNIARQPKNALPNGLIALKGGELAHEILPFHHIATEYNIHDFFKEDYFTAKKVVFIPIS